MMSLSNLDELKLAEGAHSSKPLSSEEALVQNWQDVMIRGQDGLRLYARIYGEENELWPVICLPDLIQNSKNFHSFASYLSNFSYPKRQIICIDYRGRGRSERDIDWRHYTVAQETQDLLAMLARLNVEHGHFVAGLRGAMILFALTAIRPAIMKSAVFNDVGPVIDAQGLVRLKFFLKQLKSFESIEAAADLIKAVHKVHFPHMQDVDWVQQAHELFTMKRGRYEPDFDIRLGKTLDTLDYSRPLPALWSQFEALRMVPTLVIHGEYSDILTHETLDTMKRIPFSFFDVFKVSDQGHSPLLSDAALQIAILNFLNQAEQIEET